MEQSRKVSLKLLQDLESKRILGRSLVFREAAMEIEEIDKLKWLESEKQGQDIGWEKALLLWVHSHRTRWQKARRILTLSHNSFCSCD